jgi:hypothetical protein
MFYAVIDFVSNVLILVTVAFIGLFVILYSILFNPTVTSVGRMIRRVMIALFVLGGVTVVHAFLPETPEWWPVVRLLLWCYLTYAFGSFVWVLLARRFWPRRLRTKRDAGALRPRHEVQD